MVKRNEENERGINITMHRMAHKEEEWEITSNDETNKDRSAKDCQTKQRDIMKRNGDVNDCK